MGFAVPTLTAEGYVREPNRMVDRLLANAFASDASQSNTAHGNIISIQAIIAECGQDMSLLQRTMQGSLQSLFGRYFDTAEIRVEIKPISDSEPYRMNIEVQSGLTLDGKRYNLARALLSTPQGVLVNLLPITYKSP